MTDFTQYDILKLAHQKADKELLDLKEYIEGLELQASVNQAKISQLSTDITRLNAEALDASKRYDELNSLYNVAIQLQSLYLSKLDAAMRAIMAHEDLDAEIFNSNPMLASDHLFLDKVSKKYNAKNPLKFK